MKYFLDQPVARFVPSLALGDGDPDLYAFKGGSLVLESATESVPALSRAREVGLEIDEVRPLGTFDGRPCAVASVPKNAALPAGFERRSLRRLFGAFDLERLGVAALGSQIAHFFEMNRRCGACGELTAASNTERSVRCAPCERVIYPQVAPCVIVLIHDGSRLLLTRQPQFPPGMYGLVAGFVEPGESLEACARREIAEEVGLEITDLSYVASQPWPFPSQLMMGMTARYAGGDLRVDTTELEEARWFDVSELPAIPPPFSIARFLIDRFVSGLAQ